MKKLKIYKKDNEFVIERINEFNHSFKKKYITENGLFEAIDQYKYVIEDYKLEISDDDLWGKVINHLAKT